MEMLLKERELLRVFDKQSVLIVIDKKSSARSAVALGKIKKRGLSNNVW